MRKDDTRINIRTKKEKKERAIKYHREKQDTLSAFLKRLHEDVTGLDL